jgi:hypothetical protein
VRYITTVPVSPRENLREWLYFKRFLRQVALLGVFYAMLCFWFNAQNRYIEIVERLCTTGHDPGLMGGYGTIRRIEPHLLVNYAGDLCVIDLKTMKVTWTEFRQTCRFAIDVPGSGRMCFGETIDWSGLPAGK